MNIAGNITADGNIRTLRYEERVFQYLFVLSHIAAGIKAVEAAKPNKYVK